MLVCIKAALAYIDGKTARYVALNFINMKMSNYSTPITFLLAFQEVTDTLDGTAYALIDTLKTAVLLQEFETIAPVFIVNLNNKFEEDNLSFLNVI